MIDESAIVAPAVGGTIIARTSSLTDHLLDAADRTEAQETKFGNDLDLNDDAKVPVKSPNRDDRAVLRSRHPSNPEVAEEASPDEHGMSFTTRSKFKPYVPIINLETLSPGTV